MSTHYQEIQHFYARQMRYLDEGKVADWAQTFTEDGVFSANAHPEPFRGREAIEAGARKTFEQLCAEGIQRRHWLGMLDLEEQQDGSVLAHSYALIISTPRGGQAAVHLSTRCTDVLSRQGEGWQVNSRQVYRDDLPPER